MVAGWTAEMVRRWRRSVLGQLVGAQGLAGTPIRHSCATLLFTMSMQLATVQRFLWNSSISVTTGTYVEVIEAVQRDAQRSMGNLSQGVAGTRGQIMKSSCASEWT